MEYLLSLDIHTLIPFIAILFAIMIVMIRIRSIKNPTTTKKIILPPLGMSTGFLMFLYPPTHIPWVWAFIIFTTGAIFLSIPLIQTSKFHVINHQIYLKRSRAFILILITLLVARLSLHTYIEQHISLFQTASVFFILAFGMLLPWRLVMYYRYKKFQKELVEHSPHLHEL